MTSTTSSTLRIGSRGSDLALWQARFTSSHIREPNEIVVIKTEGDRIQHLSLDKVEGKGFFTKEIEAALLAREVDIAVHSFKDLPIEQPEGLTIAAVPERGPTRDVVLRRADAPRSNLRWGLAKGARVGTSSLRRKAQILSLRPDLELVDLRGNVPTRVRKVTERVLDAVLLAEAGLVRLGFAARAAEDGLVLEPMDLHDVCPAPAQGALAIQVRVDDTRAAQAVRAIHDAATASAVDGERLLLGRFGGGCHLPLGAHCQRRDGGYYLLALVAAPDGHERIVAEVTGASPAEVAQLAHARLIEQGAERYL